MTIAKTLLLFVVTGIAEIVGCYLPYLWLKKDGSAWLLIPAAASLALFVWLLTLHPTATGRVYAAYGGVYVGTAIAWLWLVEGYRPRRGTVRLIATVDVSEHRTTKRQLSAVSLDSACARKQRFDGLRLATLRLLCCELPMGILQIVDSVGLVLASTISFPKRTLLGKV